MTVISLLIIAQHLCMKWVMLYIHYWIDTNINYCPIISNLIMQKYVPNCLKIFISFSLLQRLLLSFRRKNLYSILNYLEFKVNWSKFIMPNLISICINVLLQTLLLWKILAIHFKKISLDSSLTFMTIAGFVIYLT